MLHPVEFILAGGWVAFWLYWAAAGFMTKGGHVPWRRHLRIRAVLVVVVVVLVRTGVFRARRVHTDPVRGVVGLIVFAAGLLFAVWARMHIGQNWGLPMTQQDNPELVTNGPYRLVRHPIYSGILAGGVGTAVALSWLWLIAVAAAGVYLGYSAIVEERFLSEKFPDTYPDYKRTTKMLVPFVV